MSPRKRKRTRPTAQPSPAVHIQASATVGQAEGAHVTGAVVQAPDAQSIQIGDRVAGDKVLGDQVFGDKNITIHQPPTTPALHQLRAPVGDFVGREQEIAQLVQAARSGAVAAISGVRGMGGIGKTELAYKVAHQLVGDFPDAQIVVELRGASDQPLAPIQALQTIIRAFEREAHLPDDLAELQAIYRSLLAGKRALILADDARDATQVRPLLPPPGSALLVTSRYRFSLPGMHTIDLGILAPKEAVDLLLAICPRFGEAATALAKLCGYLPLALRVSAGLLASDATLPVARYLERLEDERQRLAGLRDGDDLALNVDASLALSYSALDPVAQAALCQLSVFVVDFDLSAARAVVMLEGEQPIEVVLGELYRRSLLDFDLVQERYNLHDLVKVFARDRLDAEAREPLMLRYAQHYAQVTDRAEKLYLAGGESVLAGLSLFDREHAHIDATWAWAHRQAAGPAIDAVLIRFANGTAHIGELRYDMRRERIVQFEAALVAAGRCGHRVAQGMVLNSLGMAYVALGEVRHAIGLYKQSLTIARETGNRRSEGVALNNLGLAYMVLGEVWQAIDYSQQSLVIKRELGDRHGEGNVLGNLGNAYYALGEVEQAIDSYNQVLMLLRESGDRRGEGTTLGNLGIAYTSLSDAQRAIALFEQQLVITREIGDRRGEGNALGGLGFVYASVNDEESAIALFEQQLAITREIGDRCGEGNTLGNLGIAYEELGEVQRAIAFYEQSLAIARAIGDRQGEALGSWYLGNILVKQGHLARGVTLMQFRVDYERSIGHADAEAHAAQVEALRQQLQSAEQHADLLQRAEAAVTRALTQGSAEERTALAEKLTVVADAYASGDAAERALAAHLRVLLGRLGRGDAIWGNT